jgi:hypothetical protein
LSFVRSEWVIVNEKWAAGIHALPPVSNLLYVTELLRDEGVAVAPHVIVRGEDVGLLLGQ